MVKEEYDYLFERNPTAWLSSRCHPDKFSALEAARRVACRVKAVQLYLVEMTVPEEFQRYWPLATYWSVRSDRPYQPVTSSLFLEESGQRVLVCEINPKNIVLQFLMFNGEVTK